MAGIMKLKNVLREPNVVQLKPWKSIHNTIKEPMITGLGPLDIKDSVLAMGFARITKPDVLGSPTHAHPFDQWIYLIGESTNFVDFDADIEFTLGDEIIKINYPCYIFVPKYTKHCPLDIKRVGKPLIFIDVSITAEASVRPTKLSKVVGRPNYVAKNNKPKKASKKSKAAETPKAAKVAKAAKATKATKAAKAPKAEKVKKAAKAPKATKTVKAPKPKKAAKTVKAPKVAKTAKKVKATKKK
ncbi:MAG: hypothetical protein GX654_20570 [Desulfatiglans sp.]|nr:hypothetical protein [Desulfatiglans sp.]